MMADSFPLSLATVAVALATMLVSVASAVISVRQVRLLGRQNLLPVVLDVFKQARTEDFFAARDWIFQHLAKECSTDLGIDGLPENARKMVRTVCFFYDNLGVFVAFNIVEEDVVLAFFGPGMERHWQILEPYVQQERELRKSSWPESSFLVFFEDLVARYRKRPSLEIYGDRRLLKVTGD
jgi:hypothetical protein